MDGYNYYKDQVSNLRPDDQFNQSIVVYDGQGNKTKTLALNEESIPVLLEFLQNELKRLESLK